MFDPNPNKSDRNLAKHGVAFEAAENFEWDTAIEARDLRTTSEVRTVAVGFIGQKIYVLVYTWRAGHLRIISLRQANKREIKRYVQF